MSNDVTIGGATIYIQNILRKNTNSYHHTMDKLATGTKFSSIGDDPVGLSLSAKLSVEVNSNERADANVKLGKDMLSVAEDGQESVISDLQRIRDLCVQAANGTTTVDDRDAILQEIFTRLDDINNVAESKAFNGIKLADGTTKTLSLQIGTNTSASIEVGTAFIDVHVSQIGGDLRLIDPVTEEPLTAETWTDINAYKDKVDVAINQLTNSMTQIGGFINRLDTASNILSTTKVNLTDQRSVIADADVAETSAELIQYQILQSASVSVLTQANQSTTAVLSLFQI